MNPRFKEISCIAQEIANDLYEEIGVWKIQDLVDGARFIYITASVESFSGDMGNTFKCEFISSFKPVKIAP